jgi:hypothetical protein
MRRAPWICAAIALLVARGASAEDAPSSVVGPYSGYELETIDAAARALGAEVDAAPEGKVVEGIDVVRLEPIEERDPAPVALDVVHTTTKEDLVRHEVLVRVGDLWSAVAVDESARNLRQLPQVSLVVCVALRGRAPGRVRLLVLVKDTWSLYPDWDLAATSGGLEYLLLEPKETNLAGRQQTLLARLVLQPASYALGAAYRAPRLDGRFLSLIVDANVIVNRQSGTAEGSYGTASIERPLFSTRTAWAWSTSVTWRDEVYRRYSNAAIATFEGLPWAYRSRQIAEDAHVTRSWGWAQKLDLTVGATLSVDGYRLPELPGADPRAVLALARAALPIGETRAGPYAQVRAYTTDFLRILDFETLALQEDYRLGHDVVVRAYPILGALGSTRDLVGVRAAAQYTVALGDGLARALVDTTTEAEATRLSDASITGDLRLVSPRTGAGRLVFDATATNRYRNYLNRTSVLGGEDRLRGYPTRYFVGKDLVALNLEARSRPVEIWEMQFGATAFYDVGEAFDGFDRLRPAHTVGAGLRAVFPQIERAVLRLDVGFPIAAGALPSGVAPVSFFVAFGQAFKMAGVPAPLGP